MFKRILSLLLAIIMMLSFGTLLSGCSNETTQEETINYNLTENIADGAILHCFCWDFETITNSMEDIAAAGFSTIQTSPINECLEGEDAGKCLYSNGDGKWYYHFQPTDYTIGNYQLGTRDQFKAMCSKADEYGIKVIVDVVPNHTSPTTSAVNENLLNVVGGMENLFHKNSQYDITNYNDRLACTTYKMGGLPDINTENKDFQDYFIAYLNDCIECGADGFRYDAAKHIALPDDPTESEGVENNFWTRVTTEITNAENIFNYGEVLQGGGDRISDYIDTIGHASASSYGSSIRSAILQENVGTPLLSDLRVGSNESVVTWVESHDNYINDGNWFTMTNEQIVLAYSIISARGKGTPLFFNRPYGSSYENQWGTMNRIGASGDYTYKNDTVVAVNFFRNAMVGLEEKMSNPVDFSSLQICRGDKGAVIVNLSDSLTVDFKTDLADGTYVDRVDKTTEYIVKDGVITCDTPIEKNQVVVLYNEGYVEYTPQAQVKIADDVSCMYDTDSIDVKLLAENATTATYSYNDGEEVEYKDGDIVKVQAKDGEDGVCTLTLRATNEAGKKTYMKYYFTCTKKDEKAISVINEGDIVYFEKPATWGNTLYAYVYSEDGGENAPWPGELMVSSSGDRFEYVFTKSWTNGLIMFNDGSENQYPGQNEKGMDLAPNLTYKAE